jgi:pimeloyl-ACP methyl ester carboxylesterase
MSSSSVVRKLPITFSRILLLLSVSGYIFLCNYALREMFLVDGNKDECHLKSSNNTFASYKTYIRGCLDWEHLDMTPYFLTHDVPFESVTFNAADGFGPIDAWFLPASSVNVENPVESVPTIIVVHGFRVCKKHYTTLIVSAMLHRNNYNVLLIDLRNHGKSTKQHPTPYATFGSKEHHDVIGAVTYLKNRFGSDYKVGLYGASMGGATALIASARDDRLKVIYIDSPACDIYRLMQGNVYQLFNHMPVVKDYVPKSFVHAFSHAVLYGVCAIAKVKVGSEYGCLPFNYDPSVELTKLTSPKVYHFDHALLDTLVPYDHSHQCAAAIRSSQYDHIVSVNIMEKVGVKQPIQWNTMCKDHTVMALVNIQEKQYEQRLISFFNTHLS